MPTATKTGARKQTDTKESFLEKIAFQLGEWDAQLSELMEKSRNMSTDAREKYYARISRIREQMDEGRKKLEEYSSMSTEAWHEVKMGAEKAWIEMRHGLTDAINKFSR